MLCCAFTPHVSRYADSSYQYQTISPLFKLLFHTMGAWNRRPFQSLIIQFLRLLFKVHFLYYISLFSFLFLAVYFTLQF